MHIQPEASKKKVVSKRKKSKSKNVISETSEKKENIAIDHDFVEEHPVSKSMDMEWSFVELMKEAKKGNVDMMELLQGKISITEVVA